MALVLQLCAKLAPPSPAPLFPTPALLFPVSDITGNSLTPEPRSKSSFPDPWAPHRCPPPCLSPPLALLQLPDCSLLPGRLSILCPACKRSLPQPSFPTLESRPSDQLPGPSPQPAALQRGPLLVRVVQSLQSPPR